MIAKSSHVALAVMLALVGSLGASYECFLKPNRLEYFHHEFVSATVKVKNRPPAAPPADRLRGRRFPAIIHPEFRYRHSSQA
jgi:hypothetical protein